MSKTGEWRDGDVFFWRYKDDLGDQTQKYWCTARRAIVQRGFLCDIFWTFLDGHKIGFNGEHGKRFSHETASTALTLEYKGNLDEFDPTAGYNRPLYDESDILDLRHSNSSQTQIYVRKGAKRSQAAMLEHVNYEIKKAEDDIKFAQWRLERLGADKAKIEAGELNGVYL